MGLQPGTAAPFVGRSASISHAIWRFNRSGDPLPSRPDTSPKIRLAGNGGGYGAKEVAPNACVGATKAPARSETGTALISETLDCGTNTSEKPSLQRGIDPVIPITGEKWAAHAEAYAKLIAEHLKPQTRWLDAGTGSRILEEDLDPLENWLVQQGGMTVGMDVQLTQHRNIRTLVGGSIYDLPFADGSFDLVTCNMVMEHLGEPASPEPRWRSHREYAELVELRRDGECDFVEGHARAVAFGAGSRQRQPRTERYLPGALSRQHGAPPERCFCRRRT